MNHTSSPLHRYGLAVGSVALALGPSLLLQRYGFRDASFPLFLFAVAITAWYAGPSPAVVAIVLSSACFVYFFTEPLYSFYVMPADIPGVIILAAFAALITWFSTIRHGVERDLREARDQLQIEVEERVRREEEVRGLNVQLEGRSLELENKNRELEAFGYSISHDLRAPLRHMSSYAQMLEKQASSVLDEKSRRYMAIILESARRMGTLIDDLLAFSRLGRTEAHKSLVSLDQVVKEALSEVERDTTGRNIAWKIGQLPAFYGDRSMLRLAFVNLLSNAIKFTRPREQAEIEIGSADGNTTEIVVFVRDNGIGFDMKYGHKLFGVFQRLHSAQAFEGTGIGLATVQRIVQRHGGRVWAEGAVDQGAVFYFSAPKRYGHEETSRR